jgi:hypothetical protein
MSLGDEQQLRQQLYGALQTITPPLAPVDAVIRKGKSIRLRRRIGAVAGLAVLVAIGAGASALVPPGSRGPVSPQKPVVTVNPPGPHAPRGLISSGMVNGKSWRIVAQRPQVQGGPGGKAREYCFEANGAVSSEACGPALAADAGGPVNFSGLSGGAVETMYGAVAPDVTRAEVILADGTMLGLHPVAAYGGRYVGFAIPASLPIARIIAYSGPDELRYAIPFHSASGSTVAGGGGGGPPGPPPPPPTKGGQQAPPRGSYLIGSGSVGGQAWSLTVHAGPWGYCITGATEDCLDIVSAPLGNQMLVENSTSSAAGYDFGSASGSVDHVIVTFADGSTATVRPADAGRAKFFAFAVPRGGIARRVTYYAASGQQITSRPVP